MASDPVSKTTRDRPAKNPGGCECEVCGCVFVGEEWHGRCAVCIDKPIISYEAVTEPGTVILPADVKAGDTFIIANDSNGVVTVQPPAVQNQTTKADDLWRQLHDLTPDDIGDMMQMPDSPTQTTTTRAASGLFVYATQVVDRGSVVIVEITLEDSKGRHWRTDHEIFRFDLEAATNV